MNSTQVAANGYRLAEGRRNLMNVCGGAALKELDFLNGAARMTPGFWQTDVSRRTIYYRNVV